MRPTSFKSWVAGSNPTGALFCWLAFGGSAMGRNYQHKRGSELFSGADPNENGGKKCYDFTTGDRVVAAVYASIGNINDGFL